MSNGPGDAEEAPASNAPPSTTRAQSLVWNAASAADRWLDGGPTEAEQLSSDQAIALAWALKDLAMACWSSEPARTQRGGELTSHLLFTHPQVQEVAAADAWVAAGAHLTRGEMTDAITRLDDARARLLRLGDERRAAQSQVPKLIALSMLGRHDEAVECADRTSAEFVALGDDSGASKIDINLGSMFMRQEQYGKASARYKAASVRAARAGDVELSITCDVGLANALACQFEFDEAIALYERSSMRIQARGLASLQSVIDSNRGALELQRGRYEHALPNLVRALQDAELYLNPQEQADSRRELADAYLALNLLPEAMALYDQVIASCVELDAPIDLAWAQIRRSEALGRLGRAAEAEAGLQGALLVLTADGNPVGEAMARLQLAALELNRDGFAPAIDHAQHAAAAFRQARVLGWQLEAQLLHARALVQLGDAVAARAQLQAVLGQADALPELAAASHTLLGDLCRRGDPQVDLARARHHYQQAVNLLTAQQARLEADEFKTAYGADKQAAFDALVLLAAQDQPMDPRVLLQSMEVSRMQALQAAVTGGRGAGAGSEPAANEQPDQRRRQQLRWLQGQWQQAVAQGDELQAQRLRERITETEQQWLEEQRRAQAVLPGQNGSRARAANPELDVAALQAAMGDDTAWVEYAVLGDTWAACVVTPDGVHAVQGDCSFLAERLEQVRFQINTLRFGAPALRGNAAHAAQMLKRACVHLQALYAMLWAPLAPWVNSAQRVIVVPHRDLHYLPFAALHDGEHWLVQRHQIQIAPSAAIWLAQHARHSGTPPAAPRRLAALGLGGADLPHVQAEVRAVAAAFESCGGQAVVHLDDAATQTALRAALPGADVLHLACHGQFRADSPYFSAVHLADGQLTLRDAASLPLNAQLVTLSACETGLSKVAPGDELLGLLRGFLMAGAPTVLSTLWTIDDAHTATLMGDFYRGLLAGERPAAALKAAQCALIEQAPHPYHWAAFTLHGQG